ncbi:hypothetical protein BGZ94_007250 [Podila epigama]|nr:hypothetical protein BGZ94_007250 [Podila epigama]
MQHSNHGALKQRSWARKAPSNSSIDPIVISSDDDEDMTVPVVKQQQGMRPDGVEKSMAHHGKQNGYRASPPLSNLDISSQECHEKENEQKQYPWLDKTFKTTIEARDYFLDWAESRNFVVRLGRSRPERGQRRYSAHEKHQNPMKYRDRQSIRVGCKWSVTLTGKKYADGPWTVRDVRPHPRALPANEGHNHPLKHEDHPSGCVAANVVRTQACPVGPEEVPERLPAGKSESLRESGFSEAANLIEALNKRNVDSDDGWYRHRQGQQQLYLK